MNEETLIRIRDKANRTNRNLTKLLGGITGILNTNKALTDDNTVQIAAIQQQLLQLEADKRTLENEKNTLEAELNTARNNNADLDRDKNAEIQRINTELEAKDQEITALKREITTKDASNTALMGIIREIEEVIVLTNNNISAYNSDKDIKVPNNGLDGFEEVLPVPQVSTGGKSMKRKRHHKKHLKGKSRKIRNKKHKSK
jgi:chromosome segregation ATPase